MSGAREACQALALVALVGPLALSGGGCAAGILAAAAIAYGGGGGGLAPGETTAEGTADPIGGAIADRFEGCLAVPIGIAISGVIVELNGNAVSTDQQLPSAHVSLLTQELQAQAIYDPSKEYLSCHRTTGVVTIASGDDVYVRFVQMGSQGAPPESDVGFGGTHQADLDDGPPLEHFQGHDDPIADR